MSALEIICTHCGADTLLRREPLYNGFTRIGDRLSCASCGFVFPDESAIPFKTARAEPKIFTEADRSARIAVFDQGENERLCRYCSNYTVNPFTQFCAVHRKEVQATDSCDRFEKTPEKGNKKSPI